MRRGILAAIVVVLVGGCGASAWAARSGIIAPYVLPGATNMTVTSQGLNKMLITYQAGGQPYEWHYTLAKRLGSRGWMIREYTFSGTRAPFLVTWYTRSASFGPLVMVESAVVGGDPDDSHAVIIRVEREFRVSVP